MLRTNQPKGPRFESRRCRFFLISISTRTDLKSLSQYVVRSEASSREQVRRDGFDMKNGETDSTSQPSKNDIYNCVVVNEKIKKLKMHPLTGMPT